MTFDQYQEISKQTAVYKKDATTLYYLGLGITGESGEIAEKLKKLLRNKEGVMDEETREDFKKEIGDVIWYLSQMASELGLSLNDIAQTNIIKLLDRQARNVLKSSGDNR